MPIEDKITRAKNEYLKQLKTFQNLASELSPETNHEKELIHILAEMLEWKTEFVILERVKNHRAS